MGQAKYLESIGDLPYRLPISRRAGAICFVGISNKLPMNGNGLGPGGRGRPDLALRFHSTVARMRARTRRAVCIVEAALRAMGRYSVRSTADK